MKIVPSANVLVVARESASNTKVWLKLSASSAGSAAVKAAASVGAAATADQSGVLPNVVRKRRFTPRELPLRS